jgi:isoleucyl-tRNA synthetase
LDRWILSRLNSLIAETEAAFDDYDPTRAARAIEDFVSEHLSNWYVRLSRRRFWKGELNRDKQAAYETLFTCLDTVSKLMSPVAPFFSDWLYQSLHKGTDSVHLTRWPSCDNTLRNASLEAQMDAAQTLCSLVLSLRKKEKIKVRQPLQRMLVPVNDELQKSEIERVRELILSETNVKSLEFVGADSPQLVKRIKPNFKTLGKQLGPDMKALSTAVQAFGQNEIRSLEQTGSISVDLGHRTFELALVDVEISTQDMPGWLVANDGAHTVALDISISEVLRQEGLAREIVNRIQNLRKDSGLELTDRIEVEFSGSVEVLESANAFKDYICGEVLANSLQHSEKDHFFHDEIDGLAIGITLQKV